VNPPDAVLCLEPGCLEDIALSPILRYGDIVLGAAGGGGEAPAPGPHRPLGAADGPSGAFAGAEETEEEPEIFYPEEELVLRLDTGAQFAVRSGDTVGRLAKGSKCLEAFPTVSRRHMAVEFREGLWFLRNLSTNGTYVNGALLDVGGEHEVRPGDDLRLSTRCRLTVVP
jgi:hypothetical protein